METRVYLQDRGVEGVMELPEVEQLEIESAIAFHEGQAQLAQEAGFAAQVAMHQRAVEQTKRKLLPAPPFQVVSDAAYEVWCLFLPTSYSREQFAGYSYDLIPPDVLATVQRYGHLFDELEIRTLEARKTNPAIFGKRGSVRYLVVRWAESRLISFKEIKAKVVRKAYVTGSFINGITSGIGSAIFLACAIWLDDPQGWAFFGGIAGMLLLVASVCPVLSFVGARKLKARIISA